MPVLKIKNNGVWEQVGGIPDHTHVIDDITDFPTSLPANGGNADTVDGKHASDFASAAEMTTVQNDINDINTMLNGIEIPTELPNPNALRFTGAVNASYDGSSEVNVEIPDISGKMDKNNPTGTGSFSLNRKAGTVVGANSHAEGSGATASGWYSHAEGRDTTASNDCSHAEGDYTTASGKYSHAEGSITTASGNNSHAEGSMTSASGGYSHAEGQDTTASGERSHAEGQGTSASGTGSHTEGYYTKASSSYQHAQGKYNIEDSSNVYADIIGNGTKSKPSNAATVDWSGNAWYAGDVYVGSTSGTHKDEGSKKLATEEYVDNSTANIDIPTTLPNPKSLTFTGAAEGTYDGSSALTVDIPSAPEIPTKLPNPQSLTFTGAVTGSYDGSNPLTVEIPVGADGKSAYQYAQDGGYTGTETEFAKKLAQKPLIGTTGTLTPTQVYDAVSAGIPVMVQYFNDDVGTLSYTNFSFAENMNMIAANCIVLFNGAYILGELLGNKTNNTWSFMSTLLAQKTDIPTQLPNPNALTFTGAVTGSYDGSAPLSVNIPSAVTDDHINELINTALNAIGVAEERAY